MKDTLELRRNNTNSCLVKVDDADHATNHMFVYNKEYDLIHEHQSCIDKERKGLLELKTYLLLSVNTIVDDPFVTWTNDTGRSDCCRWERVKCNPTTSRVIGLSLHELYFIDSPPLNLSLLYPFQELQSLNLSGFMYNGFSALFDDLEGFKSLKRLRKLEVLVLSLNMFNNSILPYLTFATSLTTLFLRGNYMDGPFPMKELKDLTNLELLDLSSNLFNGSIPAQGSIYYITCFFPSMKLSWSCVSLSFVWFSIVAELADLKKLKVLDLSGNEFSGSEFQGICELKNLQELDLSGNKLMGEFPICLTSLT
ncbi:receptor like protein 15 [Raphanus sativus]|nr:receptor like protein 15 [Raphanus sativus]